MLSPPEPPSFPAPVRGRPPLPRRVVPDPRGLAVPDEARDLVDEAVPVRARVVLVAAPSDFAAAARADGVRVEPFSVRAVLLRVPVPVAVVLLRAPLAFRVEVERFGVERAAPSPELLARAEPLREPDPELSLLDPPPPAPKISPDNTRWAASATASAIKDPRRAALPTTELVALLAESAASRPASRIFLRALGLALMAAAAAASPAASISLLIAALASLSKVSLLPAELFLALPLPEVPLEEAPCGLVPPAPPLGSVLSCVVKEALPPLLFDFPVLLPLATDYLLLFAGKAMQERNGSVCQTPDKSKATVTFL